MERDGYKKLRLKIIGATLGFSFIPLLFMGVTIYANLESTYSNKVHANLRNLAISTDTAHANTAAQQRLSASGSLHAGSDSAIIAADSLRNNVGLVGINQSAGQANQSANSLSLAIGGHSAYAGGAIAAQDSVLQSATTGPAVRNETSANNGGDQQTVISDSAFQGSRGVIQLNQIAGNLNQAVNALAIRVVRP